MPYYFGRLELLWSSILIDAKGNARDAIGDFNSDCQSRYELLVSSDLAPSLLSLSHQPI